MIPLIQWVRKIYWRRDRLPTPVFLGFPCVSAGTESISNERDQGLIPGLGRFPEEGKDYPLQYSALENSMDCTAAKSGTQLIRKPFILNLISFSSAFSQILLSFTQFDYSILATSIFDVYCIMIVLILFTGESTLADSFNF